MTPSRAAPVPVTGSRHQSGPHRVSLDVPQHGKQVPVLFDREGLVRPLPDPAGGCVAKMVAMRVCCEQPVYPTTYVVAAGRTNDEVEVIGHQASREKLETYSLLSITNQPDEGGVFRVGMEYGSAIVATINDVITATRNDRPGPPRHTDNMRGSAVSRRSQNGRVMSETQEK